MPSFVEKIRLQNKSLVMAYSGVSESGIKFFAYILCTPDNIRKMKVDLETGQSRRVFEYGEILYMEFTTAPSEKAEEFLQKWCADNGGSLLG